MNAKQILNLAQSLFVELQFGGASVKTYFNTTAEVPAYGVDHPFNRSSRPYSLSLEEVERRLEFWPGTIKFRFRIGANAHSEWSEASPTEFARAVSEHLWPEIRPQVDAEVIQISESPLLRLVRAA